MSLSDDNKAKLRKEFTVHLKRLFGDSGLRSRVSGEIASRVTTLPEWLVCTAVFLYFPMHSEIDTTILMVRAWEDGKKVYLPCIREAALVFRHYASGDRLESGPAFSIPQPPAGCPESEPSMEPGGIVIVPGLAFDRSGNRLGRGGGHYDRYLRLHGSARLTVALAHSSQLLDRVPHDDRDEKIDIIVTEKAVYRRG